MIALVLKALSFLPGFTSSVVDYMKAKADVELKGFTTGTDADTARYKAWTEAQTEANRMKVVANGWWGAKLIILTAGWPASVHFAAVMLDSLPFWIPLFMDKAHVVGSWGVPKLPTPYDGYQWAIVQSFFIVTPIMPLASAAGQWLARKR
jgi:hypothetical protein